MKGYQLRKATPAFSLLETLVSVAIVTIALLVVAGVFISILSAGAKNSDAEAGVLIAQSQLNQAVYNLTDSASLPLAYAYAVPTLAYPPTNVTINNQVFSYNITLQNVSVPGPVVAKNGLFLCSIQMWWASDASGVRQGQGKTSTSMSRLVNEQASQ